MKFGDYALIEQKRYGCENEMFLHKVIGTMGSNSYVDIPVQTPATETIHTGMVECVSCVCCGVEERNVRHYKASDVKENNKFKTSDL